MPSDKTNNTQPKRTIQVYNLVLELTRRCQLKCDHCLRGDAQNMDLTPELITTALEQVDEITQVTFTGGEPSLRHDLMRHFFTEARRLGKMPCGFYVVTNGIDSSNQLAMASILLENYPEVMRYGEPELCGVALSDDEFHESTDLPRYDYVKALTFYRKDKTRRPGDDTWIIRSGKAAENGLGTRSPNTKFEFQVSTDDSDGIYVEELYISTNGYAYPDCDMDYETMDNEKEIEIHEIRTHMTELADEIEAED